MPRQLHIRSVGGGFKTTIDDEIDGTRVLREAGDKATSHRDK
jgi:hypothetical protein